MDEPNQLPILVQQASEPPRAIGVRRRLAPYVPLLVVLGSLLLLSSCAAGPNPAVGPGRAKAGFWLGLWHGLIVPVTFVISLFKDNVSVYEVANRGNWYDGGFVLGAM